MTTCVAVVISEGWPENRHTSMKAFPHPTKIISPSKNFKALYCSLHKENIGVKAIIVKMLTIGLQISTQLLK
jgi:hypothetical protein